MRCLEDTAKDSMTKIIYPVFTFSIQIKKEDSVAAGSSRKQKLMEVLKMVHGMPFIWLPQTWAQTTNVNID